MSAHAPTPSERTNPVIWTIALVGFVIVVAWWFAKMYAGGVQHANQHPILITAGAGGPAEPDHATLIGQLEPGNKELFDLGKALYAQNCTSCHGADGGTGINAAARQFLGQPMLNGSDPYSMYLTLADGFNSMPAQAGLDGEEKYAVIHYIREAFFRTGNESEYLEVTPEYLASGGPQGPLPAPGATGEGPGPRGVDFKLEAPVAGAMAHRADPELLRRVAAARKAVAGVAAALAERQPEVAHALDEILVDDAVGAYVLSLVEAAAEGPEQLARLVTTPGRNTFQPVLALLSRDRLAELATALQEAR